MMKIYEKLCELKGCNTLTGRVIEQRLSYNGTRYPEINKKVSCVFMVLQALLVKSMDEIGIVCHALNSESLNVAGTEMFAMTQLVN